MHEYVELPGDAKVGDQATGTSTRYFLEVTNNGAADWYTIGASMGDGHLRQAGAEAEWAEQVTNGLAGGYYTDHRIVRADTTVTLTVLQTEHHT